MQGFVCGGKHSKIIHYESITQFLSQKLYVIITSIDRNRPINAASKSNIVSYPYYIAA